NTDQAGMGIEHTGHAVDFGGFERFFESKRREDGRHPLGQHGLAGTRRADHEDVVASRAGDLEGALGGLLAANVFEIHRVLLGFLQDGIGVNGYRRDAVFAVNQANHVHERADRVHANAGYDRGLAGIYFRDDQMGNLLAAGGDGDRQGAANPTNAAVERQLAHENIVGNFFSGQSAVRADNAERHGQVEAGAFFLDIGRSQVDGDVGGRNVVAAVLQRRADTLAAFAHRGIGQADGDKVVFVGSDAGDVNLNLDHVGVNAIDSGTESLNKHGRGLLGNE